MKHDLKSVCLDCAKDWRERPSSQPVVSCCLHHRRQVDTLKSRHLHLSFVSVGFFLYFVVPIWSTLYRFLIVFGGNTGVKLLSCTWEFDLEAEWCVWLCVFLCVTFACQCTFNVCAFFCLYCVLKKYSSPPHPPFPTIHMFTQHCGQLAQNSTWLSRSFWCVSPSPTVSKALSLFPTITHALLLLHILCR